jgi:hypothetical protein
MKRARAEIEKRGGVPHKHLLPYKTKGVVRGVKVFVESLLE